jgi:SNF2 family DNA or RNA helicase
MNKYLEKIALDLMGLTHPLKPSVLKAGALKFKSLRATDTFKIPAKVMGLDKAAADLSPRQEKALKKMDDTGGVILNHSTGSGKTRVFLVAAQRALEANPNKRALLVAPASLTNNVDKEILKHNIKLDRDRLDVLSYEKAVIDSDKLSKNKYALAIADEAQKLRNIGTKRHSVISELFKDSDKRLLASATPDYNNVSDIGAMVNLAAGSKVMPEGKQAFDERYVDKKMVSAPILQRIFGAPPKEVSNIKNKKELASVVNKYSDYYNSSEDPESAKHFARKEEKVIDVKMSALQHRLYKYSEDSLPWHLKIKIRAGMPLDKKDSAQIQAFSSNIRQISNSTRKYLPNYEDPTPKIKAAVDSLEKDYRTNKEFRGVVYSNFLEAGLNDYSRELTKRKIPHNIFTGSLNKNQKSAMEEEYNTGKVPVLLISSSGAEGLNLLKTRKLQILENHWNESKIKQVMGRSIRYDSHKDLPEKDRVVEIERYNSVFPDGILGKSRSNSIDTYMMHNAAHKQSLSDQMNKLYDR